MLSSGECTGGKNCDHARFPSTIGGPGRPSESVKFSSQLTLRLRSFSPNEPVESRQ
jgi:hypothetical protein